MIHKLLLKLSVAAIALSFTGQTVFADTITDGNRNKGFFESLFGVPKYRKHRRSILPWWKDDGGVNGIYGSGYGDDDFMDPEPIPGKGMGNLTYIAAKQWPVSDVAFSKLTAGDPQSLAILVELSALKSSIRARQEERQPILDLYRNAGFKPFWLAGNVPSERAKTVLAYASYPARSTLRTPVRCAVPSSTT